MCLDATFQSSTIANCHCLAPGGECFGCDLFFPFFQFIILRMSSSRTGCSFGAIAESPRKKCDKHEILKLRASHCQGRPREKVDALNPSSFFGFWLSFFWFGLLSRMDAFLSVYQSQPRSLVIQFGRIRCGSFKWHFQSRAWVPSFRSNLFRPGSWPSRKTLSDAFLGEVGKECKYFPRNRFLHLSSRRLAVWVCCQNKTGQYFDFLIGFLCWIHAGGRR